MSKSLHQLPGPKGTLLLGNTVDFARDPLGFLTRCAQEYGDIVPLRLVLSPACLLTKPEYIEQVLKDREVFIKNTPAWRALRSLVGKGLLTSEGEFWSRQRRLAQPVFHQQRIAAYGETMVAYAERTIATWRDGETRDVHRDMMQLTLNIVTKTLFNADMTGVEAQTVAHTLDIAMQWFAESRKQGFLRPNWLPTSIDHRYKNALQTMDKTIYDIIRQRRTGGEDPGDLLSMLIRVRDDADGSQMTDRQLRDELTTLMLAGHETTANTLSWTWMLLSQYPDIQAKLVEELRAVLGDRPPTVADIPNLCYTNQVIEESLRLYPPIFSLARSPIQDCELGGYRIPAGCILIFSRMALR
jgi:cytochrome P450